MITCDLESGKATKNLPACSTGKGAKNPNLVLAVSDLDKAGSGSVGTRKKGGCYREPGVSMRTRRTWTSASSCYWQSAAKSEQGQLEV
jgi:hypothetical protein